MWLLQVLPVLISALPLKEDMEEAETVYGCLCNLILASHAEVYYHIVMTSFNMPRLCQHLLAFLKHDFWSGGLCCMQPLLYLVNYSACLEEWWMV